MVDDPELERLMREGLERRADDADVAAPVTQRARAAVRRRQRGWLAAGFTAATVAAIVVVAALGSTPPPPRDPDIAPATEVPSTGDWRTEYWADMRVDVPADWGWGGAPQHTSGDVYFCGHPGAYRLPDGRSFVNGDPTQPYVGRPIAQSDLCIGDGDERPRASYVWFDAAGVEPGTVRLGGGYVQETVEVGGSTLTVATDDPELRRRILDSAGGGEMCLSEIELGGSIEHDGPLATDRQPTSMTVCAYSARAVGGRRVAALTYASRVDEAATEEYVRQVERGGGLDPDCSFDSHEEREWVVLELTTEDGTVTDRHLVRFVCAGIDVGATTLTSDDVIPLTPELARPWAIGGITRVIYGPTGGKGGMFDGFPGLFG